jgi:tetratricopeptide (TPR) repeat protein
LQALGRHAEAEAVLVEASTELEELLRKGDGLRNSRGSLAGILTDLARLLRQERRWDEAEKRYRQALEVWDEPGSPPNSVAWEVSHLHFELGKMFQEAGLLPRAAAEFTEALFGPANSRSDPRGGSDMLNDIAWFFVTCPDDRLHDPALAVRLAQEALKTGVFGGVEAAWNTLGVARYRAGDWKGAVEALTKSVELRQGGDSFDFFFLAMAHWRLGDKEKARQWRDRATEWMDKNLGRRTTDGRESGE